ncbi:MAG: TraB/GumN family protein [Thermoanaerobaculia bacterium]|nr:TraB/GumN family protein [Thermoanaerobaculia bacterium]
MSRPGADSATEPEATGADARDYPGEVRILELDGRRIVLVGTAHVSRGSVDLVRRVIRQEKPDRVCVELDQRRYDALSNPQDFAQLDLKEVIRRKQLTTLMVNLFLGAYQKRLGAELGVQPGQELMEATKVAEEMGLPIELCDRDVRVTLRRATHATPFFRRLWLLAEMIASIFDAPEISEEDLEKLKEQDVLNELMNQLGEQHPALKRVLIDERDAYLSHKIAQAEGDSLVAVVGAGHLHGIVEALEARREADLETLDQIPPLSHWWKVAGWGIPALILGGIAWIGYRQGIAEAGDNLLFWTLANGIPASLGALLAWAHPFTILAAFVAAPITSLTPVIGAAYVTAFVQAWVAPPKVAEFQSFSDDVGSVKMWWKNRLLKIFTAYLLPGLGSMIGSVVGGGKILASLFGG